MNDVQNIGIGWWTVNDLSQIMFIITFLSIVVISDAYISKNTANKIETEIKQNYSFLQFLFQKINYVLNIRKIIG